MTFHSLDTIRKHTRSLHRELETIVPLSQLTSRTLKKTDYEHALFIQYQWYTLIEPCIQAGLPARIKRECAFESALPYLIEDLSQKSMPVYYGKPKVLHQSVNWSLGASYVVLSSSCHSKLILDNLNDINSHIGTMANKFLSVSCAPDWVMGNVPTLFS
ncbi:biliverdin-producing heme oxygenase [Vibrio sp. PP-XX7]